MAFLIEVYKVTNVTAGHNSSLGIESRYRDNKCVCYAAE